MLKTVAIVVAVLILVPLGTVLVLAATKPDVFQVARTTTIQAPPARIFALINDFQRWGAWSPYETKDPAMKRTLGAVTAGAGATYAWDGNGNVGKGRMEITVASAPSKVAIKLDFERPFEAHNDVVFTLEPHGDATEVTWAMSGPTPYLAKILHVFINMDRMVGTDFEAGLAKLKAAAEAGAAADLTPAGRGEEEPSAARRLS